MASGFMASCTNQPSRTTADGMIGDSAAGATVVEADTIIPKFTDQEVIRVVAGNSIGDFLIDQEVGESNLFNRLGEVDSSDAAMCKSWSMWYFKEGEQVLESTPEFDVYASCDPNLDMNKSIQLMRLSYIDFALDNGIAMGTSVSVLKESYPDALQLSFTDVASDNAIAVYDAVAAGVAFEVREDQVTAVLVHVPGQGIENSYLPFYAQ